MSKPSVSREDKPMTDFDGPRPCRPEELDELLELVNPVFRTSKGRPPTIASDYPQIYRESNLDNVYLIRVDGAIRACAGTMPTQIACGDAVLDAVGVNCVTTDPDWQGRGLGGMIMRHIEDRSRAAGCDLAHLAAGVPEWYRRFGYEDGGCLLRYQLDRGNVELLPEAGDVQVDTGLERYVVDAQRIHDAERLGAIRDPGDVLLILARTAPELYVAIKNNRVEAYAIVNENGKLVKEHGGSTELVATLLRQVFERLDADNQGRSTTARDDEGRVELQSHLTVEVGPRQTGLVRWLERLGFPMSRGPWNMLQLLNPVATLDKLGHGDLEVTVRGDDYTLRAGEREETFTRCQLVKVIFGPERVTDIAGTRLPVLLSTPSTDHV